MGRNRSRRRVFSNRSRSKNRCRISAYTIAQWIVLLIEAAVLIRQYVSQ